jgi:hypothetical protein
MPHSLGGKVVMKTIFATSLLDLMDLKRGCFSFVFNLLANIK